MRSATLFLIAILTPCAVLAWVSWRSMREEANNIRRQQTAFYQQAADTAARAASEFMTGQLHTFAESVDRLLAADTAVDLQRRFHQSIRKTFPLAEAGLVLDSETARVLAQTEPSEQAVTSFVARQGGFFNGEAQTVFVKIPDGDTLSLTRRAGKEAVAAKVTAAPNINAVLDELAKDAAPPPAPPAPASKAEAPQDKPAGTDARQVRPLSAASAGQDQTSTVKPLTTKLDRLISKYESGIASQPREDGLFTLLWYRPPDLPDITFAVALQRDALQAALAKYDSLAAPDGETCLAILDHHQHPVAQWTQGAAFQPDTWAAPLVAREIGAALPRWEAAIFLCDPAVFHHLASAARWRLGIIVTTASLVAIGGAYFILRDARRSARDARLKTDFVSNVSHELKTPLTSIRMFSDLLGSNPAASPDKTKRYADVIAGEAA